MKCDTIISLLIQGCNCYIIQAYIFYTKISKEKKMNNDDSYFIASSMLRYEKPTAKEIFMEQAYVSIISSVSETSLLRWFQFHGGAFQDGLDGILEKQMSLLAISLNARSSPFYAISRVLRHGMQRLL
jgi:hypothetical protein